MKIKISVLALFIMATGCTSQAERLAKCESQGISRDACYISDQNRQATINAAAEKQALENSAKQYAQAVHKAHKTGCKDLQMFTSQGIELTPAQEKEWAQCKSASARKSKTWRGYGVTVVRDGTWVTVDGKPAAIDENEGGNVTYSVGLNQVIFYKSGKVALLKEHVFVGYMK